MKPKVLVSDKLSAAAIDHFNARGIAVDFQPDLGKDKDKLRAVIGDYDGLAIRSATKVSEKLLTAAGRLKVIGRAGIGVDNIDRAAASRRGIIVMNTPFGNSITTAEHAIAMMLALVRQIPEASALTQSGSWEKSRFMGIEVTGKTLGVIGAGNIGSLVCERARGLKMKVIAYDPFLGEDKATQMGVEKLELDEVLARADIITLHVPLTDETKNLLSRENLAKTKAGVRIINCARGGLIDEDALAEGLKSGHIAGAALDVFATEPATENPLFGLPNVVCTPHLGAATAEAQEKVALQVAEQMSDFLLTGAVSNALNMPSVSAEEAKIMNPWLTLSGHLGDFAGQMAENATQSIAIIYEGSVAEMNLPALNSAVVAGILKRANPDVNLVSAPIIAHERGIKISTTSQDKAGVFDGYIKVKLTGAGGEVMAAGTVFSDGKPRFIQINGINIDAEIGRYMLCAINQDEPGVIGALGQTLGEEGVNIANFTLGRVARGGTALALLYLDAPVPQKALDALWRCGYFQRITPLEFTA